MASLSFLFPSDFVTPQLQSNTSSATLAPSSAAAASALSLCNLLHTGIDHRDFSNVSKALQLATGTTADFWSKKLEEARPFISSEEDFWALALIHCGADVDGKDSDGLTPLHWACSTGRLGIAMILLDYGASLNPKALRGWTPLHLTSLTCKTDLARLLLINGADRNILDYDGLTALDSAQHPPTIEVLKNEKTRIPSLKTLASRTVRKLKLPTSDLPQNLREELSMRFCS